MPILNYEYEQKYLWEEQEQKEHDPDQAVINKSVKDIFATSVAKSVERLLDKVKITNWHLNNQGRLKELIELRRFLKVYTDRKL